MQNSLIETRQPEQVLNSDIQTNSEMSPPAIANTFVGSCGSPKLRPILFKTEMVQAILKGQKTQTRRILKQQLPIGTRWHQVYDGELLYRIVDSKTVNTLCKCPYGKIGDVLWVKETWEPVPIQRASIYDDEDKIEFNYKYKADNKGFFTKWHSALFMPAKAARLFLRITNIKVEKLKDISFEDAHAEGVKESCNGYYKNYMYKDWSEYGETSVDSFFSLWSKINGEKSLNDNPYVWVIEFERCQKP